LHQFRFQEPTMIVKTLLLSLAVLVTAKPTTIRIPLAGDVDEVTFDAARVSPVEVQRWFKLSPNVGPYSHYLVPENIELCDIDDPRYQGCGREQAVINDHNARLNLAKIRQRIRDLKPDRYPPELAAVVEYLKQVQSFTLWEETRRLLFSKHFDVSVLTTKYKGVDPKVECGAVLQKIGEAPDRATESALAYRDWHYCMWKAEDKRIGPYPDHAWQSFLSAYGIREHLIRETVDD